MIICTLINAYGSSRIVKFDAVVPPYNLIANGKLYAVAPDSWSSTDERLANLTPTYNEVFCPDVSELLELPEQVAA
jgi:hypothetical protein